jgi:molybdopterin-guanine dinucleotide biosynthesis protein A
VTRDAAQKAHGGPDGFDAVVLAGGAARRLEGVDKPALEIGGRTLLDRVLDACAEARDVLCVGPPRPTCRPVRWTREDPPGGGPVAALAAALDDAAGDPAPRLVLLAADLPFLDRSLVRGLWEASLGHEGAVLLDTEGREQWLAACYPREALAARIAEQTAGRAAGAAGLSLRRLLSGLDLARVPDPGGRGFDCDTWEDVHHVRRLVEPRGGADRPPGAEADR